MQEDFWWEHDIVNHKQCVYCWEDVKSQWSGKTKFERLLFSSSSLSVLKAVIFLRPIIVPCPRHTRKLFCQVVYYVGALAMAQMVEYCLLLVHCHHSLFFFSIIIWSGCWHGRCTFVNLLFAGSRSELHYLVWLLSRSSRPKTIIEGFVKF